MTTPPNPEDLTDAEKWRAWTKGEYRLICHDKYTQFTDALTKIRKIRVLIPPTPWTDPADTLIKIRQTLNPKT